ncbi:hypothetical protein ACWERV_17060 [Streptomyces sp. NPDC004031]
MSLTSSLSASVGFTQSSALDLGTASLPVSVRAAVQLASGTGAGQADRVFSDRRTLAASGTENLDLAGTLVDAFGATITFVKVKGLYIRADAANTNNVVLGAEGTNPWATLLNSTGTVTLRPGAFFLAAAGAADATGYAVTASTGDLLKVVNSAGGTAVSYDVVVIGTSA